MRNVIPHNQASLARAAEYLQEDRGLPGAASIIEQASTAIGDKVIYIPIDWQRQLESPKDCDVLDVVGRLREEIVGKW